MKISSQSPVKETLSTDSEISLILDPQTVRNLVNFIEHGDLTETFTKQQILEQFRKLHGINDMETVFLIAGEYFLSFSEESQKVEIASFLLKRNPKLILSE